ncbi:fimbrial protein [Acinetobacter calcoaceticus]|uniref:Fimbrial protein n=1 Tax=Acinetobacter calcoaceticus TaxID=471 RepID=A0A4R1XX03_ACICA|nr:fimbrial protein [Acinetobacter calcoaceticus]
MKPKITTLILLFILCSSLLAMSVQANCNRINPYMWTGDNAATPLPFGVINLSNAYLQPVGTLLDKIVVPPTNYDFGGTTGTTVMWDCASTDLPNIEFLVATNGDDALGGYWDLGTRDGIPDTYATYFSYVGLRLTMDQVVVSRKWKSIPVKNYTINPISRRIEIRLQDIPTMTAELYRVSQLPTAGVIGGACGQTGVAIGQYSNCAQPNAYIQLKGPGLVHDYPGEDSARRFQFWGVANGIPYGMWRGGNVLRNDPTCVARNATPLVNFDPISTAELLANQSVQSDFDASIECSNTAVSGTSRRQVAIGLQASPGAYTAAKKLGLINPQNGVTALVSDQYDDHKMAKGVGIFLKSASGREQNFIGQPGLTGGGANAGWYPVLNGAQPDGSSPSGFRSYILRYTAVLKKLPGNNPVQAGKVRATASVLVKLQ